MRGLLRLACLFRSGSLTFFLVCGSVVSCARSMRRCSRIIHVRRQRMRTCAQQRGIPDELVSHQLASALSIFHIRDAHVSTLERQKHNSWRVWKSTASSAAASGKVASGGTEGSKSIDFQTGAFLPQRGVHDAVVVVHSRLGRGGPADSHRGVHDGADSASQVSETALHVACVRGGASTEAFGGEDISTPCD